MSNHHPPKCPPLVYRPPGRLRARRLALCHVRADRSPGMRPHHVVSTTPAAFTRDRPMEPVNVTSATERNLGTTLQLPNVLGIVHQRAIRRLSSGARRTSDHKESGALNEAV